MRAQGVRSLWVVCDLCHHAAVLSVDAWSDDVTVPSFGPRNERHARVTTHSATNQLVGRL